jgi:hypothetical protein
MLWNSPKRKKRREDDEFLAGTTVGQRLDAFDLSMDVIARGGVGGPVLNRTVLNMGMLDMAVSMGTAKRGEVITAGASAAAAQTAGLAGFWAGRAVGTTVGAIVGEFLLPVGGAWVGSKVGSIVGAGVGALTADKMARSGVAHLIHDLHTTRTRVRFGGFQDSMPAYTMRQRAEQELQSSVVNAQRYLGREAQLMHQ